MGSPVIFNGSRSKLLTSNGLLTSAGRTIDYDGAINFISNPGFEINTTGYAAYADAAGTAPVNGTGGSPTVTITRSTSSPLIQTASGLFTKDAANRQGEGFSYDFTIDSATAASGTPCTIAGWYSIASGTYASTSTSSDMTIWVYDVTNSQLIQPSGYLILNQTIPGAIQAEFQPNVNSTSYRLIFHVSSTSTSAYTLKFDNLSVSPNTYNPGAVVTDWVAYTPTFTGFGTVAVQDFKYRRVGGSLEIEGRFTAGTSTATEARISLPTGITSASDYTTLELAGTVVQNVATAAGFYTTIEPSVSYATISIQSVSLQALNKVNGNVALGTGGIASISASIRVAGWGTSQVLSSDTDTRIVAALYTGTSADSVSTSAPFQYNTKVFDTHGAVTTGSSWKFTAPVPGYYRISATAATTASTYNGYLYKNGAQSNAVGGIGSAFANFSIGTGIQLNAGDYIEIRPDGSATANSTIRNIYIVRESGPAQIAASETISMRAHRTSNVTPGAAAVIKFDTKDWDSHNAYSTSTGLFTAPISGVYQISITALGGTAAGGAYSVINGAADQHIAPLNASNTAGGSISVRLLAGQTLAPYCDTASTVVISGTAAPWFSSLSISRIGNY